jgi:imidazolonepropionase-like amidohydrolase
MLEMQLMQDAGMTMEQIILASTKNAAYVCNMEEELGTLEPGKIADIIAVKENPLEDLEALQTIQLVIHNGRIIRIARLHD